MDFMPQGEGIITARIAYHQIQSDSPAQNESQKPPHSGAHDAFDYMSAFSSCMGFVFGAIGALGIIAFTLNLSDLFGIVNIVILTTIGLSCVFGLIAILRKHYILTLTPIPFLLIAVLIYHCVGPFIYFLGNDFDIAYGDKFCVVTPLHLLRVNTLVSISLSLLFHAHRFTLSRIRGYFRHQPSVGHDTRALRVLILYAIVGVGVQYGILFPAELGITSFNPPGLLTGAVLFSSLTVMMLFYLHVKNMLRFNTFTIAFVCFDFLHLILSCTKLGVIMHLSLIVFGIYLARPSKLLVAIFALIMPCLYWVLVDYVIHSRTIQNSRVDNSFWLRWEIFTDYIRGGDRNPVPEPVEELSGWWLRLNYVPPEAFAMREYDRGNPGDTFLLAIYSFVPRSLFPDKPIMTPGAKFNYLALGSDSSLSAPGIFAEAYWNGGWILVGCTAFYVGALLAWFTAGTIQNSGRFDFVWLPCMFQSLLLGFRIDGWFSATYAASVVLVFIYYTIARLVLRLVENN